MNNITEHPEWSALEQQKAKLATTHLKTLFANDPNRFNEFSLTLDDILFDYSKNKLDAKTLALLIDLANKANLKEKISTLLNGGIVNQSENRAALHTALRAPLSSSVDVQGENIIPAIFSIQQKMRQCVEKIHARQWLGSTGKPIRHIVNIGIGGSHLGPLMATHALADWANPELTCHFISNIDSAHVQDVLHCIDPETTLFIISSKSFTTLETMTNAKTVRAWLQDKLKNNSISEHFVAVTANTKAAIEFGIKETYIFQLWDWVGGRYSLWSAIGLPVAIMIGMNAFLDLLAGAHRADQHFLNADFEHNIPVIMGLLSLWYINFFGATHQAIIPYSHYLHYFRTHLQQLDMESNGKMMMQNGHPVSYLTGPVIFGEQGCNGQHAFHQLLHQGKHFIPVDFILVGSPKAEKHHHDILISSGLSQAQALMQGKSTEEAFNELKKEGYSSEDAAFLVQHKVIPGDRPSNILFLNAMTPYNLGMLLALYEHKTFVQGALWNINSFDQWGVELGKTLLPRILESLQADNPSDNLDASTLGLIKHYKKIRK